jgi:hypothetical protein
MKRVFLIVLLLVSAVINTIGQNRWNPEPDGSISWTVKKGEAHTDNIEMSGKYISFISTYGTDEKGKLISSKQLIFPMLRTIPNNTRGNFIYTFGTEASPVIRLQSKHGRRATSDTCRLKAHYQERR